MEKSCNHLNHNLYGFVNVLPASINGANSAEVISMIALFSCRILFAIDVFNLGLHTELEVVCGNCDADQEELVIR